MRNLLPRLCRAGLPLALLLLLAAGAEAQKPASGFSWPTFLRQQDLVWQGRLPTAWTNGPFLGNGLLGAILYVPPDSNAVRIDLGRSDYQDHRDSTQQGFATRYPRLPIGYFMLRPVGKIQPGSAMRLDLYNAETTADIVTTKGRIHLRAYVHAEQMVLVVETTSTGEEQNYGLTFHPLAAVSPRQQFGIDHNRPARIEPNYPPNPPWRLGRAGQISYCEQPLLFGGQLTTAWTVSRPGPTRTILINATPTYPARNSTARAVALLRRVQAQPAAQLTQTHRRWWHAYYPQSFVALPDARLESFYWIQMYKLAAATRADRALIDNQGPWLQPTPWPYATWNLNVQLSYWPTYTSNRLGLSESLTRSLWQHRANLAHNVPLPYRAGTYGIGRATGTNLLAAIEAPNGQNAPEIGCLPWACHNLWLHYRHTMRQPMLRDTLFPLLRGSINFYLNFLQADSAGRLHLPPTLSPEYDKTAPDMNFDLALLRWGCRTLLEIDSTLKINDPLRGRWREVATRLTAYPSDSTGFLLGRGLPLATSHRHYSHLLMLYPLYDVNVEQPGARALMEKSLAHWQRQKGALQGYSCTGAASIAAALGHGDEALRYLNGLWDAGFLTPNTLYKEQGPVIETPLSAAQSIHDMLLQSWGGKIRVFPAVPAAWADVSYQHLSAEGGFLVSAVRQGGRTRFVTITSRSGGPCLVHPSIAGAVLGSNLGKARLTPLADGWYRLALKKGETVTLSTPGTTDFTVRPVAHRAGVANYYGSQAMR